MINYGHRQRVTFAHVANGSEAYPRRWIGMLVKSNCEKSTAEKLMKCGYETFVTVQQEIHQWSDRKKKIDRLMLPMVVFVRASVTDELWLRSQSYVYKLLSLRMLQSFDIYQREGEGYMWGIHVWGVLSV